jgi:hypothetical protein
MRVGIRLPDAYPHQTFLPGLRLIFRSISRLILILSLIRNIYNPLIFLMFLPQQEELRQQRDLCNGLV